MQVLKIIGGIICSTLAVAAIALMVVAGLDFGGIIGIPHGIESNDVVLLVVCEVLLFTMLQVNLISAYLFGFRKSDFQSAVSKKNNRKK